MTTAIEERMDEYFKRIAPREFTESETMEHCFIVEVLSHSGRMLGDSDSRVKNANLCTDERRLWFGDVDLKKDAKKLQRIADGLNKKIYVLREMDARFENENKPLLEKAKAVFLPAASSGPSEAKREKEGA